MLKNLLLILAIAAFVKQEAQELDHKVKSAHIEIHYSKSDERIAPELLRELEPYYVKLSEEFDHEISHPIQINLYESQEAYHKVIGHVNPPNWVVAGIRNSTIFITSPSNCGPVHTEKSIRQILKLNVVESLLYDKFGKENLPYWLAYGIGSLKVGRIPSNLTADVIPLSKLEAKSFDEFVQSNGHNAAKSFVKHIHDTHGWEALLEFASSYESLKDQLHQSWASDC